MASESVDAPTTLSDWLRALPDETLARLLTLRPDLATPPPADFDVLAARLDIRVSVVRALERLDTFTLETGQALALQPRGRSSLVDLEAFCGGLDLRVTIDTLRERCLVWGDDAELRLVGMARDMLGDRPVGLGRPARDSFAGHRQGQLARLATNLGVAVRSGSTRQLLLDDVVGEFARPERVRELVSACSPAAFRVAERLAAGPALGTTSEAGRLLAVDDARTPVEELLARGLLAGVDEDTVELPREIGLVLRGDAPAGVLHPEPPEPQGNRIGQVAADQTAAGAAEALVRHVTTLLEAWSLRPPTPLRTGGLGVRDFRATAKLLDLSEDATAVVVEVASSAGLVAVTPGADAQVVPTTAYDRWATDTTARRWAVLVDAWCESHQLPGLVGERDDRGRQVAPMSLDARRGAAPELRSMVLAALAVTPPGLAPAPDSVRAVLAWTSPRRGGTLLDRMVGWTCAEAEILGVTGRGALTTAGRLLVGAAGGSAASRVDHLADAIEPAMPQPVKELIMQADLTAVAPGPLLPTVAADLADMADVESAGAATVYRFSEESIRRAFDSGLSADEVHAFLGELARGGVPQTLTYLIDDTARRHGRLRSGPAGAYLRCDDTALLAEVVASRRTAGLNLRRIAPTVVISSLSVPALLEGLRAAGFAPVAEGPDGRVVLARPAVHRAPARPGGPGGRGGLGSVGGGPGGGPAGPGPGVGARAGQMIRDTVRLVRRGDESARAAKAALGFVADPLVRSAPRVLVTLQGAVRDRRKVILGFVDEQGAQSEGVVRPLALDGGWLTAWDERSGGPRRFVLHRVTGVAEIDDSTPDSERDSGSEFSGSEFSGSEFSGSASGSDSDLGLGLAPRALGYAASAAVEWSSTRISMLRVAL